MADLRGCLFKKNIIYFFLVPSLGLGLNVPISMEVVDKYGFGQKNITTNSPPTWEQGGVSFPMYLSFPKVIWKFSFSCLAFFTPWSVGSIFPLSSFYPEHAFSLAGWLHGIIFKWRLGPHSLIGVTMVQKPDCREEKWKGGKDGRIEEEKNVLVCGKFSSSDC